MQQESRIPAQPEHKGAHPPSGYGLQCHGSLLQRCYREGGNMGLGSSIFYINGYTKHILRGPRG